MKRIAFDLFLALAVAGTASMALARTASTTTPSAADKEFKGSVTDDMCGGEHMMEGMTPKECADECVRMGSSYALYVTAEKKMYAVDHPEKLEEFSGEDVIVKGTLTEDGTTIQLTSVQKAPSK